MIGAGLLDLSQVTLSIGASLFDLSQVTFSIGAGLLKRAARTPPGLHKGTMACGLHKMRNATLLVLNGGMLACGS